MLLMEYNFEELEKVRLSSELSEYMKDNFVLKLQEPIHNENFVVIENSWFDEQGNLIVAGSLLIKQTAYLDSTKKDIENMFFDSNYDTLSDHLMNVEYSLETLKKRIGYKGE